MRVSITKSSSWPDSSAARSATLIDRDVPARRVSWASVAASLPGSDGTPDHPGHVGIYLGSSRIIEAPETGKRIMIVPLNGYWSQHAVALRRII
jgi:uncharacterized protein YycO